MLPSKRKNDNAGEAEKETIIWKTMPP